MSVSVTIYPLQLGFDGGGMENSIMKTPALLITASVSAPMKDRSARVGLHPGHPLLVLKLCEDGPPAGAHALTPTQTLCTQLLKEGWSQRGLWCVHANWESLHAEESSQLGGEWNDAHLSSNGHTEEVAKPFFFVVKNGHDSRGHSLSLSLARGNVGSHSACLSQGALPAHLQPWPHVAPVIPAPEASSEQRLCPQRRRMVCFDGRIINVPQLHSCKIPGETRRV